MTEHFERARCYHTVEEVLSEAKNWALLELVAGKPTAEQVGVLEKLFLTAAEKRDDAGAAAFLGLIFRAITDEFVAAHRDETGAIHGQGYKNLDPAGKKRAEKAIEIWPRLPDEEPRTLYVQIAEDESRPEKGRGPTLKETKKAALAEIAYRWGQTKDEAEADAMLRFLAQAHFLFEEEKKMFAAVIREDTGQGFPSGRLLRSIKILGTENHLMSHEALAAVAMGFARNAAFGELTRIAEVIVPIQPGSSQAFRYLEKTATSLAALDAKSKEIEGALGDADIFWRDFQLEFEYPSTDGIVVKVKYIDCSGRDENWFHDQFTKKKAVLAKLQEGSGKKIELCLHMVLVAHYNHDLPIISREQAV